MDTNTKEQKKKDDKKEEVVEIPKKMLREIAKISAETAVAEYRKSRDEELGRLHDKRLHNSKLLLTHYKSFKEYSGNAIYETAQLCNEGNDEILSLMGVRLGENHQVGSIRNSVIVTRVILEHVDTMLDCYRMRCLKSSKPEIQRRWRVISMMYLEPNGKTAQEIADTEHISKSSVYLDIDNACEELSSLFFGLNLSEYLT